MATVKETGVEWRFANQTVQEPVGMAEQLRANGRIAEADALARKCNSILLSRGREPSRGCVAMLKSDYELIERPHDCKHTLTINGRTTRQIKNLCVTKVTALVPGFESKVGEVEPEGIEDLDPDTEFTDPSDPFPVPVVPTFPDSAAVRRAREAARDDLEKRSPPKTIPSTWCMVEFADARHYAGQFSGIDEIFNPREVHEGIEDPDKPDKTTYKEIIDQIWTRNNIRRLFGGKSLEFHVTELQSDKNDLSPENLKFLGINAWDALWVVLDLSGWTFYLDDDGSPNILQPGNEIDKDEFNRLIGEAKPGEIRTTSLLVDAGNIQKRFLPEAVLVTFTRRDYQFDQSTLTSGDEYRKRPTQDVRGVTREILKDTKHPIAADTTKQLWGAIQVFYGDDGEPANLEVVHAHAEDLIKRYLRFLDNTDAFEYTWIGILDFRPSRLFSGVLLKQFGPCRTVGLNSQSADPAWVDGRIEWQLAWSGEESRPGALTRDAVPHGRELFADLVGPVSGDDVLMADKFGSVSVLKGVSSSEGVEWTEIATELAVNGTGGPLRRGLRVFCKWNYQLGVGGAWVIVAARSGGGADWEALCLSNLTAVREAANTGLVVVNRRSMLRLVRPRRDGDPTPFIPEPTDPSPGDPPPDPTPDPPRDPPPDPVTPIIINPPGEGEPTDRLPPYLRTILDSARGTARRTLQLAGTPLPSTQDQERTDEDDRTPIVIDLQHGPPNTVLWTAAGTGFAGQQPNEEDTEPNTIYWTDGPSIRSVRVQHIRFATPASAFESTLSGPRSPGIIDMRLPRAAARTGQFLTTAAVSGNCTETGWFGPGVDCTIKVASECFDIGAFMDYFCEFVDNCINFGNPFGSGTTPPDKIPGAGDCNVTTLTFDHGLLFQGAVGGASPSEGELCKQPPPRSGGAVCVQTSVRHFNPCRSVEDDLPTDPGDPGGPSEPIDPNE